MDITFDTMFNKNKLIIDFVEYLLKSTSKTYEFEDRNNNEEEIETFTGTIYYKEFQKYYNYQITNDLDLLKYLYSRHSQDNEYMKNLIESIKDTRHSATQTRVYINRFVIQTKLNDLWNDIIIKYKQVKDNPNMLRQEIFDIDYEYMF
jgi:hypothetical protein